MKALPCPVCDEPLRQADRPTRIMNGRVQKPYACACGVEAWIGKSVANGQPFVASFMPNQPLRVRVVREED